jgi:hypothetical protein
MMQFRQNLAPQHLTCVASSSNSKHTQQSKFSSHGLQFRFIPTRGTFNDKFTFNNRGLQTWRLLTLLFDRCLPAAQSAAAAQQAGSSRHAAATPSKVIPTHRQYDGKPQWARATVWVAAT